MADPAELLQQLYLAGFEFQSFEQFPRAVGVVRDECVALLLPAHDGLQILGAPGWLIGGNIGVLTTVDGQRAFQWKSETVEATPERLEKIKRFEHDLRTGLHGKPQ